MLTKNIRKKKIFIEITIVTIAPAAATKIGTAQVATEVTVIAAVLTAAVLRPTAVVKHIYCVWIKLRQKSFNSLFFLPADMAARMRRMRQSATGKVGGKKLHISH